MRSAFFKNSTWTVSISGMLLALVGLIHDVAPDLGTIIPGYTDHHAHALMGIGTFLAALGSILARAGGVSAAQHVESVTTGTASVTAADAGQALPVGPEPTIDVAPRPGRMP